MSVQVPLTPDAVAPAKDCAVVVFTVHGLSDAYLQTYLDEITALRRDPDASAVRRRSHRHGRKGNPPDAAMLGTRVAGGESLHEVRSVDELGFALVSDHDELGSWGRTFPVPLVPGSPSDAAAPKDGLVYIGQASLPMDVLEAYQREGDGTNAAKPPLTCRVVIVKKVLLENPPPAVQASPGSAILAVDNAHTYPRPMRLWPLKLPAKVNLADAATLTDSSKVEMLLEGREAWRAVVDMASQDISDSHRHPHPERLPKVRFSPTETQFPFLRTLPRESPSLAKRRILQPDGHGDTDQYRALNAAQHGPLLSLSFFGNDPRKGYNRGEWLATLPVALQEAVTKEDEAAVKLHGEQQLQQQQQQQQQQPTGGEAGARDPAECGAPILRTVPFSVSRVRPVVMEGSCWCETTLPTPAPVQKQMDEVKREQDKARSSKAASAVASTPLPAVEHTATSRSHTHRDTNAKASTVSSMASYFGSGSLDDSAPADGAMGWCVRPLRHTRPVTGKGLDVARTQDWWNCVVNLACLENQGLEVEVEVPLSLLPAALQPAASPAASADGSRRFPKVVRGSTVLVASMFNQGTKGVMQTSISCRLPPFPRGTTTASGGAMPSQIWVFLHVQYLFTFPYNHDNSDLRVVRSMESHDRLTVPTLVGHRGLGKTYTRRGMKPGQPPMSKLAENSIESLNAAHQRGCEMVEFDVMLTRDRIPVIFHDPILVLHAREKDSEVRQSNRNTVMSAGKTAAVKPSNGLDESANTEGEEGENSTAGVPHHLANTEATALSRLQRWYLQKLSSYVPIPVAIHSLTKRQLDALVTESFSFGGREPPRLKVLVLQHWLQILRIYRNRSRLQCMRSRKMAIRPVDVDEFRGCGLLSATALTSPLPPMGGGGAEALPPTLATGSSLSLSFGGNVSGGAGGGFVSGAAIDGADGLPARFRDPMEGIVPVLSLYRNQLRRTNRMLSRQEDITNRIPAFYELFLLTPPSLCLNIEVKYPFMPRWDANLFQQADAFEVNGFVDAILDVVFAYADEGREIAFSSFEPDICLALAAKQSRYDVLFLSDTEEKVDLKDYRSFHLEGAIQFAHMNQLAGISINATSLPLERHAAPAAPPPPKQVKQGGTPTVATTTAVTAAGHGPEDSMELFSAEKNVITNSKGERKAGRVPLVSELIRRKAGGESIGPADESELRQWCDWERGKDMVAAAHARGLKVWTWGDDNSDLFFAYVQGVYMGVDAIITDHVPV